ncbi:MAG: M28 family peptidase [Bacteroidota bacterium]
MPKTPNLKIFGLGIFCSFFVLSSALYAQEVKKLADSLTPIVKDSKAEYYSQNISVESLSKNLHVLASDEFEGRETGKKGQKMAASYIAAQFKAAGIPPYKDTMYYQPFMLNVIVPSTAEVFAGKKKYKNNIDYYTYPDQVELNLSAENILFLGYGLQELSYNDYEGMDVKDKVLMILEGEPFSKDSLSLISGKKMKSSWLTDTKLKIKKAGDNEVKGLLIVVEDIVKDVEKNKHKLESSSMKLELPDSGLFVIYISKKMATDILNAHAYSKNKNAVDLLKQKISETGKPFNMDIPTSFNISVKNVVKKVSSENVLGFIEGSDLKEEVVVITAHYDHLGKEGAVVFNGADDDGSGTVAVIELAKTFAKAKQEGAGPRRSMLFMTVAGEEKGLLGSSYYVNNPVYPLKNTVCDLNIDMIGRLDDRHPNNPNYVYLIGSDKLSSGLHKISEKANKTYTNLELDYKYNNTADKNRYYYRSDHYNFAKNDIPVIFYFNGTHVDYHKETDEVEKIDFNKIQKITKLVFFTAWELVNRDERIIVDSDKK